ncbi:flagellar protein FlaG [Kerstersia similis]|uniref:flagellar protein FlaG n=1 Tax=Kerstersia similis TaxID=206505 RepID=UPI0039F04073
MAAVIPTASLITATAMAPAAAPVSAAVPETPGGLARSPSQEQAPVPAAQETSAASPALDAALAKLNQSMQAWGTRLSFVADQDAHRIVIRIIDSDSGEVIKTIPSEAVLHAARLLKDETGAASTLTAQA